MSAHLNEWLHFVLRWFHIVAGIMWIGNSFFFMWLDRAFAAPAEPREGVTGELFMVHGGGYYQVERRQFQPGVLPPVLHWFKWEATLTWISGFCLLLTLYYVRGGILLVDPSVSSNLSPGTAMLLGLSVLPGAWLLYDMLWASPLGKNTIVAGLISFGLLVGLARGLTYFLGARAAFMHVGAVLGTIMVLNVWVRILPPQRRMLAAVKAGKPIDPTPGKAAKKRSTHNTYVTLPVIFIMISNHFSFVGWKWNWIALGLLMLAGAAVREFMLVPAKRTAWLVVAAAAILVALYVATAPPGPRHAHAAAAPPTPSAVADGGTRAPAAGAPKEIDPATVGSIHGVVSFTGAPPAAAELPLPGDCMAGRSGPAHDEAVVVEGGKLANVLVYISEGAAASVPPPAPTSEVVIDQHGCTYQPHVIALRVGQPLAFTNSDPLTHNIHGLPENNDTFNEPMPAQSPKVTRSFDTAEIFQMKCDIHPWMNARVGVFEHGWFAVTDAKGEYQLGGVPPGDYTLTAWHEKLGQKTAHVTVAAKAASEAIFSF